MILLYHPQHCVTAWLQRGNRACAWEAKGVMCLWLVLGCAVCGGLGARSGCGSRACSLLIPSSLVLFLLFQLCLHFLS